MSLGGRVLFLALAVAMTLSGALAPAAVAAGTGSRTTAPAEARAALSATAASVRTADPSGEPTEGPAAISALHTVEPSVLTPDDETLTLTGTVENTGDEPIDNVQVLPRLSRIPLESRSDIRRVATDESLSWGARYDAVFDPIDERLAPGEARTFTLAVPTELLSFDQAGVYVVGVDVMGSPPDSQVRIPLHTSRTVVPWLSGEDELPAVPVAMLWPLAARPSMMPDGSLLDNSVSALIGSGEPLSAIARAGSDAPVTWAVDPDLLDTIELMGDGYQVASPTGLVEGSQADSDAARQWRSTYDEATGDSDVMFLPYATPDIKALTDTQPELASKLSEQSLRASAQRADSAGPATSGVAWLDRGSVTDEVLATLAGTGAGTVIVPGDAVAESPPPARARFTVGEQTLDAVVTDTGLSDAIADAALTIDPRAGAVDVRQRWTAETAMIAMEAADHEVTPDPLVAAPPIRWRPGSTAAQAVVDAWTTVPWVQPVGLSDLGEPDAAPTVAPDPAEGTNVLPEANVTAISQLDELASRYTALVAEPGEVSTGLVMSTLRAASTGWLDDPAAGAAYATAITDDLTTSLTGVSVTVPESVTLSSRTGEFPLTVSNTLSQPVTVGLDLHSTNVDRLRVDDVAPQQVEPGERALVTVTAQAAANGKVPINVQLTTADGIPIGPSQPTVVNATDYGTIGWIIVGAAGVLFAAAVIRRTIRRRQPADEEDAAGTDAEPVQEAHR